MGFPEPPLDPPEEPEPPQCLCDSCGGYGEYVRDGMGFCAGWAWYYCDECSLIFAIKYPDEPDPPEPEPEDMDAMFREMDDEPGSCPHGKDWGHCDACDYLGDIAFDAAREDRYFGRR